MEEAQRRVLQRSRLRLVQELRVDPLWELLLHRGVFTQDMVEEIQRSGTRRDQARQLVTDLQTRGKQAFPVFLWCLQETGQTELATLLSEGYNPAPLCPIDVKPVKPPLRPGHHDPRAGTSECLPSPVQHQELPHHANATPAVLAIFRLMISRCGKNHERVEGWPLGKAAAHCLSRVPKTGSEGEKSRRNSELTYTLKSDPCGSCLIINNVNFSKDTDLDRRTGSDIDCERLEKRFRSLHFDVMTRHDLKAHEIAHELQSLARQDHTSRDCCLVVLLSHGCQTSHIQFPGGIFGSDGRRISVEKIVGFFNGNNCPTLRGKPKLFFIQACGGEQKDRGFEVDSDSPRMQHRSFNAESDARPFQAPLEAADESDAVASLPTPSDILVSYSTFPGFVSWRDKLTGSWYVETLDQVLDQYARSEDLLSMLVRVQHTVSAKGMYKQMPGCFNFLRKQFFFLVK